MLGDTRNFAATLSTFCPSLLHSLGMLPLTDKALSVTVSPLPPPVLTIMEGAQLWLYMAL